jgi:uncharacterized protein YhbP (UPF0306 family)
MALPDQRIVDFIREHHVLTLAISRDNIPYCASCYYAYLKVDNRFFFTSDPETRHVKDVIAGNNYCVGATIALETKIVGKIRGIQVTGTIRSLEGDEAAVARSAYLKRFPVARLMPGLHLWSLTPDFIKMTDNRLGFGKKLIWMSDDVSQPATDGH